MDASDGGRYQGAETLASAKRHLENDYAVVGITEDLEAFLFVLERMVPSFFKGALSIYEPLSEYFLCYFLQPS